MRIAPIILGNVISSRFLKRPPRSTNIAWFTDQCFLTEEILPTLDLEKILFPHSPITEERQLQVLEQLTHKGIPPQEILLSYIMVLSLLLASSPDISLTKDVKDTVLNYCEITNIATPDNKILLSILLHYLEQLQGHASIENLRVLLDTHSISIPSIHDIILSDMGSPTTSLDTILLYTFAVLLESDNYGDALRLAIYVSRDTTYIAMLVSTICSLIYPLEATKSRLPKPPKRFEYRPIQEMDHMPDTITRFRGPFKFLSNLYPTPIAYKGHTYCCLEAAYQAQKSLDPAIHERFANIRLPYKARGMGQRIKTIRPDWFDIRISIMEELLYIKFSHPQLKEWLQFTGQSNIVECNTWGDTFWGVYNGVGENHLGTLLMKVRDTLL